MPAVSRALGIQLTRRRQKDAADIPMCGIPAPRSAPAIVRLSAMGHKIAVSEQPASSGGERSNNLVVAHAELGTHRAHFSQVRPR